MSIIVGLTVITSRHNLTRLYMVKIKYQSNSEIGNGITQSEIRNQTKVSPNKSATNTSGYRKDKCEGCFLHNYNYVINNEKICDINSNNNKSNIDVIILILTTHQNIAQRKAIRSTWLTHAKNNTANVRYVFLLGNTTNKVLSESVEKEAKIHRDIIKEDFIDAYMNLTLKTLMGFRWVTTYCSNATFVMKTDDDMWVNVPALVTSVKTHSAKLYKGVGGICHMVGSPIRSKQSKWYASIKSYPRQRYPGFCAGPGYVTTAVMAKKIFEISKHVPFFHLEDVYVSLCIRALGLRLYPLPGYHNTKVSFDPCAYKSNRVITSHRVPPVQLYEIWKKKCP